LQPKVRRDKSKENEQRKREREEVAPSDSTETALTTAPGLPFDITMKSLNEKVWGFHSWSFSNLTTSSISNNKFQTKTQKKEKELQVKT